MNQDMKHLIARRAAQEARSGNIVNLGIGIPTLVVEHLPEDMDVYLHTENGLLGVGPSPKEKEIDPDLVNAGKLPVTEELGCSFFNSEEAFAMIRGGHIDLAILGALQVDESGRVANWSIPGKTVLGVGGAMDLMVGAKRIIVTMNHTSRDGHPKLVNSCQYPLTAERSVDMIITELAVFQVTDGKLILRELMPGASMEEVISKTSAHFICE